MAVMHPASQEKSQTTRTTPPSITITMSTTFLNARVLNKVAKELYTFQEKPVEGLSVSYDDEDMSEIYATIDGPMDTPFEGGQFKMKLTLGSDFPSAPPKGFFQTKIFHPNVSTQGEICINTLKKDWKPELGLTHVFLVSFILQTPLLHPIPFRFFLRRHFFWTDFFSVEIPRSTGKKKNDQPPRSLPSCFSTPVGLYLLFTYRIRFYTPHLSSRRLSSVC
eukprot:TRINITY_DN303_c0_g1_i4.p1 TRINITY_DN303_c0_g1~~TRINITY_DN303_c0_g1_i4.p1  ORF type:complete len:221 (+),score=25.22 TRINITY_DN303_c0_g1_i4:423-1085(+)